MYRRRGFIGRRGLMMGMGRRRLFGPPLLRPRFRPWIGFRPWGLFFGAFGFVAFLLVLSLLF